MPLSKVADSQASSPLNCHCQAMVSCQNPFCFSSRVPNGSPDARHEPMRSLKACSASLGVRLGAPSSATAAGARTASSNEPMRRVRLMDGPFLETGVGAGLPRPYLNDDDCITDA